MHCMASYDKLFIAYMNLQRAFQAAISENELFLKNTEWIHWILEIQLKYVHLSILFTFAYNSNLKLSAAKEWVRKYHTGGWKNISAIMPRDMSVKTVFLA